MSYILDAIKKAEQKRELGTVPDVNTVHETPPIAEPRRSGWLYGLAAVLIVNAVGIGWWLWPANEAKGPAAQAPDNKAQVAESAPKPQTVKPPQAVAVKPAPTPAATSEASAVPPQPVQAEIQPGSNPDDPSAGQAEAAKPPAVVPQSAAPGDKTLVVEAKGTTAPAPPPANLAASQPLQPPVKVASPPIPVPPPPPQSVQAGTMTVSKPATPAAVQVGAAKVPPLPSTAAKAPPAGLATNKAEIPAPGPATAGVVPVLKSEAAPATATPEEPLSEAEEKDAQEVTAGGDGEAVTAGAEGNTGGDQAGLKVVGSLAAKSKAKKGSDKEDEDPELAKIPFLKQLPPDVQQTIPEMHISFHSYSIKPSARLVSIGGKILREGESYDENVKLETITVKGVVLVCKGRRFRLKV